MCVYGLSTRSSVWTRNKQLFFFVYIVTGLVFITETECSLLGADCVLKYTVFARVICALFFVLTAEKSVCIKYADFFCGGLDLGFILV
jgi:hypothetical protein